MYVFLNIIVSYNCDTCVDKSCFAIDTAVMKNPPSGLHSLKHIFVGDYNRISLIEYKFCHKKRGNTFIESL